MGGRRAYFELAPESKKTLENSANMIKIEATAGKRPSCRSCNVDSPSFTFNENNVSCHLEREVCMVCVKQPIQKHQADVD